MSRWRNNGGWNKSHGTVEKTPRVDSFEAGEIGGWGTLFGYAGGSIPLVLDCNRRMEHGPGPGVRREYVEVWHNGRSQTLELSHKENGFGGSQTFFLCPACGERRRYLYLAGVVFLCRKCAQVNYKSQQETKSDSMYYYDKGMALVEKHLDRWPLVRPDGFSFCDWVPDRPRYMHQTTYRRYLARFLRYRRKHADREMADMLRLIGFSLGPGAVQEITRLQYED